MGLWIVILLAYQARVGALYGDLALLAAAFMVGLAGGARLRARVAPVDGAFALLAGAVALLLPLAGGALCLALAVVVGAAGGATLANAAAAYPASAPRLYAWDLAGGAVAALLFGGFLVPALGVPVACATAAALKLLSLAVWKAPGKHSPEPKPGRC